MRNNIPDPEFSDALFVKNGFITDTSFSNIALFDGKKWYTPVTPLLKGTKREYYIENKIIFERKIKVANLDKYWKVRMINAMLDMENEMDIPVECIIHPKIG
jgi:4-amino-4-deoxychorismate lyase